MSIRTEILDELPDAARRSARDSVCQDIVDLATAQAPKVVKIESDDIEEFTKLYKAMIQFRTRHRDRITIGLRKAGDAFYVWIIDEEEAVA